MKKIAFLLALLMLTSGMAFTASALDRAEISVDGLNVPRGENKLIVYNMSGTNTGTNQYGYEVRVGSDGKISSVGGNDSVVPEGGLVLSGHGTAATFLRQNAKVGRYARFLEHSMMLIIDDSYIDPFFSTSLSFDGINTGRAANTIIIYNRSGQRTNTNEYGF
ncbi:MAG: hypothetical protein J5793_00070, partial [Clostridia bacterium]|nr:hypothetical protein [Clostridia bacterium]